MVETVKQIEYSLANPEIGCNDHCWFYHIVYCNQSTVERLRFIRYVKGVRIKKQGAIR
jgi:hypothetical protein